MVIHVNICVPPEFNTTAPFYTLMPTDFLKTNIMRTYSLLHGTHLAFLKRRKNSCFFREDRDEFLFQRTLHH